MCNEIKQMLINNGYTAEGLPLTFLAATTSYRSAIIRYKGHRYYIYCIKPWVYCPQGLVKVELL